VKGKSTSATILRMQTDEAPVAQKRKIAVLGSGIGRNYQALHDSIVAKQLDAEIVLVLSDNADSGILQKAAHNGASHLSIQPGDSKSRLSAAAEKEITDRIRACGADLVVLAGFMRIVSPDLIRFFAGRIINIHPSLLPKHRGRNAIAQALADGSTMTGCTIHHVDAGIDTGEIIAQTAIAISPGETESELAERIHAAEHALLPKVIANLPLPTGSS
jgi:phosphoribosylglycinamide formyltransferase-1